MPVKFVGRKSFFRGNTLYWLAANLKDLGVGRVFVRSKENFPEKSFYKLTKVTPDISDPNLRKGSAWGERVFRGKHVGNVQIMTGHKKDWKLIPKENEEEFCKIENIHEPVTHKPKTVAFPPFLGAILKAEKQLPSIPMLNVVYPEEPIGLPYEDKRKIKNKQKPVEIKMKL